MSQRLPLWRFRANCHLAPHAFFLFFHCRIRITYHSGLAADSWIGRDLQSLRFVCQPSISLVAFRETPLVPNLWPSHQSFQAILEAALGSSDARPCRSRNPIYHNEMRWNRESRCARSYIFFLVEPNVLLAAETNVHLMGRTNRRCPVT